MARIGTSNLNLGTWAEGEHPGAGSQTEATGSGLNENWLVLDAAVGVGHTTAGAHKSNVITGANLVQTGTGKVADDSTLEFAANMLQVKDAGISGAKLGLTAADGTTLEVASSAMRIKDGGVIAGKLLGSGSGKAVDNVGIGLNGSNELQLLDDGITASKICHDNARTKVCVAFGGRSSTWMYLSYQLCSATVGWIAPRAGCITAISCVDTTGKKFHEDYAYSTTSSQHFVKGSILSGYNDATGDWTGIAKDGVQCAAFNSMDGDEQLGVLVMEVEFDDN